VAAMTYYYVYNNLTAASIALTAASIANNRSDIFSSRQFDRNVFQQRTAFDILYQSSSFVSFVGKSLRLAMLFSIFLVLKECEIMK